MFGFMTSISNLFVALLICIRRLCLFKSEIFYTHVLKKSTRLLKKKTFNNCMESASVVSCNDKREKSLLWISHQLAQNASESERCKNDKSKNDIQWNQKRWSVNDSECIVNTMLWAGGQGHQHSRHGRCAGLNFKIFVCAFVFLYVYMCMPLPFMKLLVCRSTRIYASTSVKVCLNG